MENKKSSSKKKLISDQEEKENSQRIRGGDSNSEAAANSVTTQLLLDLKILKKKSSNLKPSRRVIVTIQPRSPSIKTIFVAEKSRFSSRKSSEKSRSLAIGDHPSFTSRCEIPQPDKEQSIVRESIEKSINVDQVKNKPLPEDRLLRVPNAFKTEHEPTEKCRTEIQPPVVLTNHSKPNDRIKASNVPENSPDFIVAYSSANKNHPTSIVQFHKNIHLLARKVRRHKMAPNSKEPYRSESPSEEESDDNKVTRGSGCDRPGCSYIDHYSHIPETSAFHRYAHQTIPLSTNKGTTIEKEHNSEQYGRDFTAYDGITARGRRQCVSATNKREEHPRQAAERMTKIRHKLNPVRDYKLMDTVHYLAQGEFAPRNDGIKLTPSREAVLSDIIWEDVCRTHWPGARLGRRHQERSTMRSELQRLIDNLLRERVAHVERRRRRHYRIVKLNHRHETSGGPVGKTDIIVASHKHRHLDDDDMGVAVNSSGGIMSKNRHDVRVEHHHHHHHRSHRSHDRLMTLETDQRRRLVHDECTPGPSYAVPRASRKREPTCCYHASSSTRPEGPYRSNGFTEKISSSSTASSERNRNPRLVVKKDSRRRHHKKEEVNLDHFILLPTLVVRTPSNVKRQKKFNELYHRILNHLSDGQNSTTRQEQTDPEYHQEKD